MPMQRPKETPLEGISSTLPVTAGTRTQRQQLTPSLHRLTAYHAACPNVRVCVTPWGTRCFFLCMAKASLEVGWEVAPAVLVQQNPLHVRTAAVKALWLTPH
jgi:hypothetical protein